MAHFAVAHQPGRPYWRGPPPANGRAYMPAWSASQVQNVTRDMHGRLLAAVPPHYLTRSPRQPQPALDATGQMWLQLHARTTHAKQAKELPPKRPVGMFTRPPEFAPFPQPSVPSPRMKPRPQTARAYPGYKPPAPYPECFPPFKKIVPGLMPRQKAAAIGAPAEEEVVVAAKAASPVKKKKALESVSPDEVRKAAAALKEKLIDKFGNLTRAFRAIDVDGSGTITRDELERYLEIINLHTSTRKDVVDALFELIDADESGNFDYKEFARVMSAGDVMNMGSIAGYYDGFSAKAQEAEERERAAREAEAAAVGMTADEYAEYYGIKKQYTSADMEQVARDRWGHKIKGHVQNFAT